MQKHCQKISRFNVGDFIFKLNKLEANPLFIIIFFAPAQSNILNQIQLIARSRFPRFGLNYKLAAQRPDDFSPAFQGRVIFVTINARRGQRRLKSSVAAATR